MTTKPSSANKFNLPYLGYGLGLRSQHYNYIIQNKPEVDWFEIISENYMNSRGRPREKLDEIRSHYPVVMHGVSLSIGSTDPLNIEYLQKLKQLADEIKPVWISDHLCWTGINGRNTHDLLPVPLTTEALHHITDRIKQVQDLLGRTLLLENPSSYLTFRADHIPEYEFMAELAEKADCALLLDINNIYVASYNQRLSPKTYIDAIPQNRVVQFHLAGHTNAGTHIVDTHDTHVNEAVWDLYAQAQNRFGNISTMVEWDGNIPEFSILEDELNKARNRHSAPVAGSGLRSAQDPVFGRGDGLLLGLQAKLQTAIHDGISQNAETWIEPKENFPPNEQLQVYINAYRLRLADAIIEDYPKTAELLGDDFKKLVKEYIEYVPSTFPDLANYCWGFADFISASPRARHGVWLQGQNNQMPGQARHDHMFDAAQLADTERKKAKCFDLENSPAITSSEIASITEEEFLALSVTPRKASFILQNFALYRDGDEIKKIELAPEEIEFLQSGKPIGELITNANAEKTQTWFGKWLAAGFISRS